MYTFYPLPVTDVSHAGFGLVVILCLIILVAIFNDRQSFGIGLMLSGGIIALAGMVSFVWTEQTPTVPANIQVIGKFVGFQPEGYNEQSGKNRADHHYMYVIYEVDGQMAIFKSNANYSYPKLAILYKN